MVKREQLTAQYDSWYGSQERVLGDGKPNESVCKIKEYIQTGQVLDIGGGEGRDALYLAEQGFEVEVVDLSVVGLEKLKKAVLEKEISITTKVGDVIEDGIEGEYEVVVMSFILHHMSSEDAQKVIKDAQAHTTIGGVHTIETFMPEGELYERNEISGRFYPSKDTLRELYADWDIKYLSTREELSYARNKNGERMKNMLVMLVAQKLA